MADDVTRQELIRRQFERAAQLAARRDAYAARWAAIHDAIATAAARKQSST